MEHPARREPVAQVADQRIGVTLLGRPDRAAVPLVGLAAVRRHEGRLAAGGETDVLCRQIGIDPGAQRLHRRPAILGERLGDAHRLGDAGHGHLEMEADLGGLGHAADRRGRAIVRRRAQRDMALARKHARGRVHRDPAGARDIGLGPGVEIDDVLRHALGPLDRLDIGDELDRIARDEARGEAQPAQELDQQPRRIAARSDALLQRLLGRLHARFHADDVADPPLEPRIDVDEEVDRALVRGGVAGDQRLEQRPLRLDVEIGGEIGAQVGIVGEGIMLGRRLDEEVERIHDVEIGEQVDVDREMIDRIGKDDPRQPVAVRVLLPVEEVVRGLDGQRVVGHLGAAVRRRPQPHDLRPEPDRAIVAIGGEVVQAGLEHPHSQTAKRRRAQPAASPRRIIRPRRSARPRPAGTEGRRARTR